MRNVGREGEQNSGSSIASGFVTSCFENIMWGKESPENFASTPNVNPILENGEEELSDLKIEKKEDLN